MSNCKFCNNTINWRQINGNWKPYDGSYSNTIHRCIGNSHQTPLVTKLENLEEIIRILSKHVEIHSDRIERLEDYIKSKFHNSFFDEINYMG